MMTEKEIGHFKGGMFAGFMIGLIFCAIVSFIYVAKHPLERHNPNYMLNSPDYRIDTITTIVKGDTTVTYEFKVVK